MSLALYYTDGAMKCSAAEALLRTTVMKEPFFVHFYFAHYQGITPEKL